MPGPNDPVAFRANATLLYWIVTGVLGASVLGAGLFGWSKKGGLGLVIGLGIGVVVAGSIWFALTLLWAMTQDGA